jgi:hypothetical protein
MGIDLIDRHYVQKFSIVTPSYNQESFIEKTLQSVIDQHYPNLEYIVVEDGSTDRSLEVISKYESSLTHLITGPNQGFGAAVNTGLQLCTGEIMAWINSDDFYLPGAFETVARVFADCPEVDWIVGASLLADQKGKPFGINSYPGFGKGLFFSGRYLGGHAAWGGRWIPQESVFWRRSLWQKAGARFCTERLQYGDFELWSRFWQFADLHAVPVPLAVYRCHPQTYTARIGNQSVAPCTKIIEDTKLGRYSPLSIRVRDVACRLGNRVAHVLGEPAKAVEFDRERDRWQVVTRFVM